MKKFALELLECYTRLHESAGGPGFDYAIAKAPRWTKEDKARGVPKPPPVNVPSPNNSALVIQAGVNNKHLPFLQGGVLGSQIISAKGPPPAYKIKLDNWYAGQGDGEEQQGVAGQKPVQMSKAERQEMERQQRQQETTEELNQGFNGLGDAVNSVFEAVSNKIKTVLPGMSKERLHSSFFSNANNSVRTMSLKMLKRNLLFVEQTSDEEGVTVFEREPPSESQVARSFKQYEKLVNLVDQLKRSSRKPEIIAQDLRKMKNLLYKNEKGQIFLKIDGKSLGGVCIMPSERHPLSEIVNEYEKEAKKFEENNPDVLDPDETLQLESFDFSKTSFNHGNVVKEVSEKLEQAAHYIASGNYDKAKPFLVSIAKQYKDSIGKALQLKDGMLSEDDEMLVSMLDRLDIKNGTKDEVEQGIQSILRGYLQPRIDFYNKFKPQHVSRVGGGDVGKGDKADNLMVWREKPTDPDLQPFLKEVKFQNLDKDTQKTILSDGGDNTGSYYVVGVSLKTYMGGTETKAGSTYGFVGVGDRYDTGTRLGDHEATVRRRMIEAGMTTGQFDDARAELSKLTKASRFCRGVVANDDLNLVGKTAGESKKVVLNHIKLMMDTFGIDFPLDDDTYFEKLEGKDGVIDARSLSRFSTYLEKELHMKIMEKSLASRGSSFEDMDRNDPILHALLLLGVDAGLDTTQDNLMGVTTKTDTNESHVYNQNQEIMSSVEGVLSGERGFNFSRSGLRIDRGMMIELKSERNRVAVNAMIPSLAQFLDLIE